MNQMDHRPHTNSEIQSVGRGRTGACNVLVTSYGIFLSLYITVYTQSCTNKLPSIKTKTSENKELNRSKNKKKPQRIVSMLMDTTPNLVFPVYGSQMSFLCFLLENLTNIWQRDRDWERERQRQRERERERVCVCVCVYVCDGRGGIKTERENVTNWMLLVDILLTITKG